MESLKELITRKEQTKQRAENLYLEGIETIEFYQRYKAKYDEELASLNCQVRSLERLIEGKKILTEEEMQLMVDGFFLMAKSNNRS